ncbi:MAG TPA: hypothetical protein VMR98_00580 [Candidatus Polarisedimenticolaceae bacterium]|nr:hypothetical protein [Candidatus Polarisedimenticolaceae bacterium]
MTDFANMTDAALVKRLCRLIRLLDSIKNFQGSSLVRRPRFPYSPTRGQRLKVEQDLRAAVKALHDPDGRLDRQGAVTLLAARRHSQHRRLLRLLRRGRANVR